MTSLLASLIAPLYFTLHVCESGSGCQRCEETIRVAYFVDVERQQVRFTTTTSEGKYVDDNQTKCQVQDSRNWSCQDTRSLLESREGQVKVTRPHDIGRRFEFFTGP